MKNHLKKKINIWEILFPMWLEFQSLNYTDCDRFRDDAIILVNKLTNDEKYK